MKLFTIDLTSEQMRRIKGEVGRLNEYALLAQPLIRTEKLDILILDTEEYKKTKSFLKQLKK